MKKFIYLLVFLISLNTVFSLDNSTLISYYSMNETSLYSTPMYDSFGGYDLGIVGMSGKFALNGAGKLSGSRGGVCFDQTTSTRLYAGSSNVVFDLMDGSKNFTINILVNSVQCIAGSDPCTASGGTYISITNTTSRGSDDKNNMFLLLGDKSTNGSSFSFRLNSTTTAVVNFAGGITSSWAMVTARFLVINSTTANISIYRNGVHQNSTLINGNLSKAGTRTIRNINLGIDYGDDSKFYNGYFDEFSIWNSSLTPGDINLLYNCSFILNYTLNQCVNPELQYDQTPTVSQVNVSPALAYKTTNLSCSAIATVNSYGFNPLNDTIYYNFTWFKNGVRYNDFNNIVSGANNTWAYSNINITPTYINRGDVWKCSVQAYKAMWYGNYLNSTGTTINFIQTPVVVYSNNQVVYNNSLPTEFNTTNINLNITVINSFLSSCTNDSQGYCYYPIKIDTYNYSFMTLNNLTIATRNYPSNVSVGINGLNTFFNSSELVDVSNNLTLNVTSITTYLSSCSADSSGFCYIPLDINSSTGNLTASNLQIMYNTTNANNVSVYIEDELVFQYPTEMNSTQVLDVNLKPSIINKYLSRCNDTQCFIKVKFTSIAGSSYGYVNLSVNYTIPEYTNLQVNTVNGYLKSCTSEFACNVTFNISGTKQVNITWSIYEWFNRVLFYSTANTTNITANIFNTQLEANQSDSTGFFEDGEYFFEFIPQTPTQKQVAPYGQNNITPIINVSIFNPEGYNTSRYYRLKDNDVCVNLSISEDNKYSNSIPLLNNTWVLISQQINNPEEIHRWMWADYECNYSTWKVVYPDLDTKDCCLDCICRVE